ncbi:MAG: nickel pincer cofactor biosynthesis protein LarB [Planctomycetes bacterium]|nr:nickel pincer cofactor biosynthesis protein LarB [Planctomycetota bacterium]
MLRPDFAREERCGDPEVIFAPGKALADLEQAADAIVARHGRVLITRLENGAGRLLAERLPRAEFHERARCLTVRKTRREASGRVAILCAGTSDVPVAEEARVTAEFAGCSTDPHYDVGIAGVHRLLAIRDRIEEAHAIIVVAGMEGALPSLAAGLVTKPVIAVPTSVGYGASFGGLAALLAMLNSCAAGVSVVNIDNGFGAAMIAARINRLAAK